MLCNRFAILSKDLLELPCAEGGILDLMLVVVAGSGVVVTNVVASVVELEMDNDFGYIRHPRKVAKGVDLWLSL
ncbi:hypothetical protein GOBAR_DD06653 [Gossypium barbadense]|nr:hypothetical protein GOBAR_DD06653 [Gossypium barbadense]